MSYMMCYEAFPDERNEDRMRKTLVGRHGFVEKNNHKGVYFYKEISSLFAWKINKLLNKKKFRYRSYDKRYARSSNYRKKFLKKVDGPLFCAYCGKRLKAKKMEVDHIIPVNQAKTNPTARLWLQLLLMNGVNDSRNLVSSCEKCNLKKSDKMGFWVIKGFIGKHRIYWIVRKIIIGLLLIFVGLVIYSHSEYIMKIISMIKHYF